MFLAFLVVLAEKLCLAFFENLSELSLNFYFFSACLAFIKAIWPILP